MDKLTLYQNLGRHRVPVLIDFWAPWCVPCRMMEPVLKKIEGIYAGRVDIWKINADEDPDLVRQLGVMGIPTMITFKDGQELFRLTGSRSLSALTSSLDAALAGKSLTQNSPSSLDRVLRLTAAGILMVAGFSTGPSYVLVALAGLIAFFAIYDRCLIWQHLFPRLKAIFRRS